jgi:BirA family biotin operon repressor/biotin-[acetyl-CoA-carboxylase] ligase
MANTLFIGKVYLQFDELPSTNDYALELLAKSKPPEGTAIRAASQSAGRGQFGSRWDSQPGKNLLISIVLYPGWLPATDQFRLSEIAALAVWETITAALDIGTAVKQFPKVRIKWPNDLCIGTRKVGGILIQNTIKGMWLESSVIGIGLNINQLEFPESLPNATSMALASGLNLDPDHVAEQLFTCLERRYLQLKQGHSEIINAHYHAQLLGLGAVRTFARADGTRFQGIIRGVASDGHLLLEGPNGMEQFTVKSVRML